MLKLQNSIILNINSQIIRELVDSLMLYYYIFSLLWHPAFKKTSNERPQFHPMSIRWYFIRMGFSHGFSTRNRNRIATYCNKKKVVLQYVVKIMLPTNGCNNMLGLPGGVARNFNMRGGVGCVNVGVHVYTWYAAGVLMCTHGTWGGVGCVNVGVHVYT